MIEEGRMKGEIDQVDEIVRFEELNEEQMWNDQIKHTCDQARLIKNRNNSYFESYLINFLL